MSTLPSATAATAVTTPERSAGHIAFAGAFEFYELGGQVYRALASGPINDCRLGVRSGRWESSRAHFDHFRAVITGEAA